MVNSPAVQYLTVSIPAGGTLDFNVSGSVLSVKACSLPAPSVTVNFNDGLDCPITAGLTIDYAAVVGDKAAKFRKLQFKNAGSVAATVGFFFGSTGVAFNPVDQKNAPTIFIGNLGAQGTISVAQNTGTKSTPTNTGNATKIQGVRNGLFRKQVIITNLTITADLHLYDRNFYLITVIYGQASQANSLPFVFECSDDLYLLASAAATPVAIGELYFAQ